MNNNEMIINENEDEDNSDSSPEEIKEKIKYNNKDNKIEENEREFDLDNECELNISTNSIISLEKQIDSHFSPKEIISIKQFRTLLGILGHKSTNFIVERLYQALIRITSKKYQHISSNLYKKDFSNFLSIINGSKIHHEIFYLFFDISNKGYIVKNDFINVISNMCETICEFTNKNPSIYKENISNLYDYLLQINMKANGGGDNNQQWISKSGFIRLIESDAINFYDIMNIKNIGNNIFITQNQYGTLKNIMYSIKTLRKKVIQKENIESNLSLVTDNYLDNIGLFKDEYKEMKTQNDLVNNSFSLYNTSSFLDKSKLNINNSEQFNLNNISNNITFNPKIFMNNLNSNMNKISSKTLNLSPKKNSENNKNDKLSNSVIYTPRIMTDKLKSPQERILTNNKDNKDIDDIPENDNDDIKDESLNSFNLEEENEKDEELNYKFLTEENEDVCEMDNKSIKDIQNIKKKKTNVLNNNNIKENPLNNNRKKNFFFLKPFKNKNDKELEKELKKNNIDINNTLILLKKDNFLSYIETLENCIFKEINDIKSSSDMPNIIKNIKTSKILNKPLKEKEIFEKEKSFDYTLNNDNMEIMLAITMGMEKCISANGDYELQDKNYIYNLVQSDESYKTTRKRRGTMFLLKNAKTEKKNSELYEAISNYPFKKYNFIFDEINTFSYYFYTLDKKDENNITTNKIEISEYAPKIFCNIRYTFGDITNKDFLHSFNIESLISNIFLGNIYNLNELLTINKDNLPEFIMFSPDTKYIIKCIAQNEFEFLLKILPNYYEHLINCIIKNLQKDNLECQRSRSMVSTKSSSGFNQMNNNIESTCTLLDIIYGLYSVNLFEKKIFFIIKKNIFYSHNNLPITKKYDLKGSSIDRTSSKNKISDVYKDLDYLEFKQKICLSTKISNYLSEILEKDTLFLSENNIINYSFYIGIAEIPESYENDENEEGILSLDKNNIYYFGISDIFTEYNTGKKMEHIFKKITKGSGISAVPPVEYKTRFDNFIKLCLK